MFTCFIFLRQQQSVFPAGYQVPGTRYQVVVVVVVVAVVLTLTHRYNAVRGHRTGSKNSGAEDYLRRKNK